RRLRLHLRARDDRCLARVPGLELPEGKDFPGRRRRLSARLLAGGDLGASGSAASGSLAVVPDAAARLSDIRDALFHVSQEVHTRPIARTAGPHAHASSDLHAADAGPHGPLRPCVVDPAEQQGRAFRLADDLVLRRARLVVLGGDAVARYGVTPFLRRLRCALSLAVFLEPRAGFYKRLIACCSARDQSLRGDRTPCQRAIARFLENFSSIKRRALCPHSRLKSLS